MANLFLQSLASRCLMVAALLGVTSISAFADSATAAAVTDNGSPLNILAVLGALGALVLTFIQLILGLSLAAFAITKGLAVLSRLLGGLDIWGEIKKGNSAVALLAAGVVISYCTVIGGGIEAMTKSLFVLGTDPTNGFIELFSGFLNLAIAIMVASFAITVVFKVIGKLTTGLDDKVEFLNGNVAIGVVYCGTLIGVSALVAKGVQGIGTGVAMLLTTLMHQVFH